MKHRLTKLTAAVLAALILAGCSGGGNAGSGDGGEGDGAAGAVPSGEVSVYSREDGSGTRGAFVELMGIEEKDASGEKVDMTTTSAAITNSTSVIMTSVAGDENGIGYISLGSVDSTVKAVQYNGVDANEANILNGTYGLQRPFVVCYQSEAELSDLAKEFIDFIMSAEGQAILEKEGYISETH